MATSKWQRFADRCAKTAHRDHFAIRRGSWYLEDMDVVVLFNNNPYAGGPHLRDRELADLRRRLTALGICELAYATYPADGYTYALVLDTCKRRSRSAAPAG